MTIVWGRRAQLVAAIAAALASAAGSASAQDQGQTGDGGLRPLCTDRPGLASSPCTVDKGHFQVESDLTNGTYDRSGGMVTDTYLITQPTLKYGVTADDDVQVQLTPYEIVRTHTPGGDTQQLEGFGDVVLRWKHNLTNNDTDGWNVSLFPFLQLPTGRTGIGDGGVEGGLLLPLTHNLTKTILFDATPEVDLRRNMDGHGVHPVETEVANIGIQLPANLTFSPEIYVEEDQDPAGAITHCSADVSLAWLATQSLQFDVGANIGLNPQTAAVQAYIGVSHKF